MFVCTRCLSIFYRSPLLRGPKFYEVPLDAQNVRVLCLEKMIGGSCSLLNGRKFAFKNGTKISISDEFYAPAVNFRYQNSHFFLVSEEPFLAALGFHQAGDLLTNTGSNKSVFPDRCHTRRRSSAILLGTLVHVYERMNSTQYRNAKTESRIHLCDSLHVGIEHITLHIILMCA